MKKLKTHLSLLRITLQIKYLLVDPNFYGMVRKRLEISVSIIGLTFIRMEKVGE